MALISKIAHKYNYLRDFYIFQHLAIPRVSKERISKSILKKYLPASPVIIDCGAHDGTDSIELNRVLGGTLHAFEPVPEIFQRLADRTRQYPRITSYPLALSNKSGIDHFFVSEGDSDASSSLLPPKDHLIDHTTTFFNKKIEVTTITLDDWAIKYNIDHVDMLWLDMQGFEMQMLKASNRILPSVKVIHTEVSVKETYEGVGVYDKYRDYLESLGFKVVVEAIPKGYDMGNVLFVRR
ncbi:FkbM family methyltransferase [Flavitalea sp. BT771]|uniref:FkbM family methyltransferase n=1 Tax=Flavitalea sp. BT771 TaxID=3063329 RepID=UPI0026E1EB39|nr:FkbM family methyltransferase [Flavitalea sp. BT771]MDO6434162.1 FkbM family methyltransferase [Flavitalea sp. BT771]MDV6223062.1 FkbM family methyltransferase [Flavitalea sp. BT771]